MRCSCTQCVGPKVPPTTHFQTRAARHFIMASVLEHLLKNRTIRNYLDRFSECNWESSIKFTLIYGVQQLTLSDNVSDISIEKLQSLICTATMCCFAFPFIYCMFLWNVCSVQNAALLSVDDSIPELRHRLNKLQLDIVPAKQSR